MGRLHQAVVVSVDLGTVGALGHLLANAVLENLLDELSLSFLLVVVPVVQHFYTISIAGYALLAQ